MSEDKVQAVEVERVAFIDNQNLYMSTRTDPSPWHLDMGRFRIYLRQKYKVEHAYLFMGAYMQDRTDLYQQLQKQGFILVFREHTENLKGKKKGNVDVDIVFQCMRYVLEDDPDGKVILVSGDGDYKRMVNYLIDKGRFEKILLPSKRRSSSLYKSLSNQYYAYLDTPDMRQRLEPREDMESE